jgi:hypothetical protein
MIVSHRHKFIFIKTRKTAGTSIEAFLAPHCGPDDILTPISPPVEGHCARNDESRWPVWSEMAYFARQGRIKEARLSLGHWQNRRKFFNHMTAEHARARLPRDVWSRYFKFCVERNPFDKSLSHFHMLKAQGMVEDLDGYLQGDQLCRNSHIYTDGRGRLLVDRVLRFENLDAEFGEVMERLGLPYGGQITVRAKSNYRADRTGYREVLTPAQRARIEQIYADEMAQFSYEF